MRINEVIVYRSKWYLIEGKEGKNTHLEHLEDLVFNNGFAGAQQALQYVEGVRDMLNQGGSKTQITVKWDGAPAIICGIDPEDGQFFVGTKGVFAKDAKLVKNKKNLDEWYSDSALHDILGQALALFPKLNIGGVLQGDLLFGAQRMPTQKTIDGEDYLVFRPNTITYAVKVGTDLAKKIASAKCGIVFHTTYIGSTIADMQAEFGANITGLTQTSDVWVEDAYYKDYTGHATLSDQENALLAKGIEHVQGTMGKIDSKAFDTFLGQADFAKWIKPFMNTKVRSGQSVGNPTAFLKEFIEYFRGRMQTEIEKLKGGPESPAAQQRLERIAAQEQFIADNSNTLLGILAIYKQLISLKLMLISKLNKVEGIGTFLKTDTGYKVTNPEGFVAIGHDGGAVKLNDRLEFNRANFTLAKEW